MFDGIINVVVDKVTCVVAHDTVVVKNSAGNISVRTDTVVVVVMG